MVVVTKGPVATAGSILSLWKINGTEVPTKAATVMDDKIEHPTTTDKAQEKGADKKLILATAAINAP